MDDAQRRAALHPCLPAAGSPCGGIDTGDPGLHSSGWKKDDIEALFKPHTETQELGRGEGGLLKVPASFQEVIDYFNWEGRAEWEVDYSGSYALHAFDWKPEGYWPVRLVMIPAKPSV